MDLNLSKAKGTLPKSNNLLFNLIRDKLNRGNESIDSILNDPQFKDRMSKLLTYYTDKPENENIETIKNKQIKDVTLTPESLFFQLVVSCSESLYISLPVSLEVVEGFFENNPTKFNSCKGLESLIQNENIRNLADKRQQIIEKVNAKKEDYIKEIKLYYRKERTMMLEIMSLFFRLIIELMNRPGVNNESRVAEIVGFLSKEDYFAVFFKQLDKIKENSSAKKTMLRDVKIFDRDATILAATEETLKIVTLLTEYSYIIPELNKVYDESVLLKFIKEINSGSFQSYMYTHLNEYHDRTLYNSITQNSYLIEKAIVYCLISLFGISNIANAKEGKLKLNSMPLCLLSSKEKFESLANLLKNSGNTDYSWNMRNMTQFMPLITLILKSIPKIRQTLAGFPVNDMIRGADSFLSSLNRDIHKYLDMDPSLLSSIIMTEDQLLNMIIDKGPTSEIDIDATVSIVNNGLLVNALIMLVNKTNINSCFSQILAIMELVFNKSGNFVVDQFPQLNFIFNILFEIFPFKLDKSMQLLTTLRNESKQSLKRILDFIKQITIKVNDSALVEQDSQYYLCEDVDAYGLTIFKGTLVSIVNHTDGNQIGERFVTVKESFNIWEYFLEIWKTHINDLQNNVQYYARRPYSKKSGYFGSSSHQHYNGSASSNYHYSTHVLPTEDRDKPFNSSNDLMQFNKLIGFFVYVLSDSENLNSFINLVLKNSPSMMEELFKILLHNIVVTLKLLTETYEVYRENDKVINSLLMFLNSLLNFPHTSTLYNDLFFTEKFRCFINNQEVPGVNILEIFRRILSFENESEDLDNIKEVITNFTYLFSYSNLISQSMENAENNLMVLSNIFGGIILNYVKQILSNDEFVNQESMVSILSSFCLICNSLMEVLKFTSPSHNIEILERQENNYLTEFAVNCLNQTTLVETCLTILKIQPFRIASALSNSTYTHLISYYLRRLNKHHQSSVEALLLSSMEAIDNILTLALLVSEYQRKKLNLSEDHKGCNRNLGDTSSINATCEIISSCSVIERVGLISTNLSELPTINVTYTDNITSVEESIKTNMFLILFSYTNFDEYGLFEEEIFDTSTLFFNNINSLHQNIYLLGLQAKQSFYNLSTQSYSCLVKLFTLLKSNDYFRSSSIKEFLSFKKDFINTLTHSNYTDNLRVMIRKQLSSSPEKLRCHLIQLLTVICEAQPLFFAQLISQESGSNDDAKRLQPGPFLVEMLNSNYKIFLTSKQNKDNHKAFYSKEIHINYILLISVMISNSRYIKNIVGEILKNTSAVQAIFDFLNENCQVTNEDVKSLISNLSSYYSEEKGNRFFSGQSTNTFESELSLVQKKLVLFRAGCTIILKLQTDSYSIDYKTSELSSYIVRFMKSNVLEIFSLFVQYSLNPEPRISMINSKLMSPENIRIDQPKGTALEFNNFGLKQNTNHSNQIQLNGFEKPLQTSYLTSASKVNSWTAPLIYSLKRTFSDDLNYCFNIKDLISKLSIHGYEVTAFIDEIKYLILLNIQYKMFDLILSAMTSAKYLYQNLLSAGNENIFGSLYFFTQPTSVTPVQNNSIIIGQPSKDTSLGAFNSFRKMVMTNQESISFRTLQFGLYFLVSKDSELKDYSQITSITDKVLDYSVLANKVAFNSNTISDFTLCKSLFYSVVTITIDFNIFLINLSKSQKAEKGNNQGELINNSTINNILGNKIPSILKQISTELSVISKEQDSDHDLQQYLLVLINLTQSIFTFSNSNKNYFVKSVDETKHLFINAINSLTTDLHTIILKYQLFSTTIVFLIISFLQLTNTLFPHDIQQTLLYSDQKLINTLVSIFNSIEISNQLYIALIKLFTFISEAYKKEGINLLIQNRLYEIVVSSDRGGHLANQHSNHKKNMLEYEDQQRSVGHIIWCSKLQLINNLLEEATMHSNDISIDLAIKYGFDFIEVNIERINESICNMEIYDSVGNSQNKYLAELEELYETLKLITNLGLVQNHWILSNSNYNDLFSELVQKLICISLE